MLTPSQLFPKSYGGALLHIKRWPCFCCQGPSTLEQQRLAWHCFIFKGINKAKKSPFLENTRSREQPFSTTEPGCHLTLSVFMSKKTFDSVMFCTPRLTNCGLGFILKCGQQMSVYLNEAIGSSSRMFTCDYLSQFGVALLSEACWK